MSRQHADALSFDSARPLARRFARTRPEEGRFRRVRDDLSTAGRLVSLASHSLAEDANLDTWRQTVEAAAAGWNLAVLPTELDSSWLALDGHYRAVAQDVLRRKLLECPDDRAVVVSTDVQQAAEGFEVSVTFTDY